MSNSLEGKVAVVTGAASGIGAATVEALLRDGATVMATDVNDVKGAAAVAALNDRYGGRAHFRRHNVADEASWEQTLDSVVSTLGSVDVIVNNAGVIPALVSLENTTLEEWRRVMSINLEGVFLGIKHGFRRMKVRGGSIINLSSVAAIASAPLQGAYAPSKGGVLTLTKAAALEGARLKPPIRVNAVLPGYTETSMVTDIASGVGAERVAQRIRKLVPLGVLGAPADIAEAIAFLASDKSKFMTGSSMVADGGYTAQ